MKTEETIMFTNIKLKNFLSFGNVNFNFKKNKNNEKKFIAIYGENGSGKSNFVTAIDLLCRTLDSFENKKKSVEFIDFLNNSSKDNDLSDIPQAFSYWILENDIQNYIASCRTIDCNEPTEVEYSFILNGIEGIYKYSFDKQFINESLYYLAGKQRGTLFNITTKDGKIEKKFYGEFFTSTKVRAEYDDLIEKYWGKYTFLAIIVNETKEKNKSYVEKSLCSFVMDVISMLRQISVYRRKDNTQTTGIACCEPHNMLFELSEGTVAKNKVSYLDTLEKILKDFFTQAYSDIKDVSYERQDDGNNIKYQLFFDKMISGKVRHINFANESSGTQQILEIVKMLLGALCGATVVFDEIDNGIHDLLLKNILDSMVENITGQLIITTHNTLLMEALSSHSAYVISSDYSGNKEIRCLDEFDRIQSTNNARIKYLKGMFGGIPYGDGIDYDFIINELHIGGGN